MKDWGEGIKDSLKDSAKSLGNGIKNIWEKSTDFISKTWSTVVSSTKEAVNTAINSGKKTWGVVTDSIEGAVTRAWDITKTGGNYLGELLKDIWQEGSSLVIDGAKSLVSDISNFAGKVGAWYTDKKEETKRIRKQVWGIIKRDARKLRIAEVPTEAKEYADFAELARNDKKEIPEGYTELITDEELSKYGLNSEMLKSNGTGFGAKVFLNKATGELTVSFAGTDPTSIKDWWTDIRQSLGFETGQYDKAKVLANALMRNPNVDLGKLTFIGHSLGGGMASLAGSITGSKTVTFNSAGVHHKTLERAGVHNNNSSNITSYIHRGDMLKYLQEDEPFTEKLLPDPLGSKIYYGSKLDDAIPPIIPPLKAYRLIKGVFDHPEYKD